MELNHILLFTAVATSALILLQAFQPQTRGRRARAAVVLIASALGWLLARPIAGWLAAIVWCALLVVPAFRRNRARFHPFRRSGPGAANWRILFRRLLFGLGNRIEHRHRFANETETARAGATRRRLRLRYGRRRHMDRFPPPSSPRSARPKTFAKHLRDRPPATRLRSCHSSRQHVSPPRWPPHRIPPRPGRPGKIYAMTPPFNPSTLQLFNLCNYVTFLTSHQSLLTLSSLSLPAPCPI